MTLLSTYQVGFALRVISEANSRGHWRPKAARAKQQRWLTSTILKPVRGMLSLPVKVTFTRLGPRTLDSDNLAGAFKAVRDGVADVFGVDDGDERYEWCYAQEKAKEYGIRIDFEFKEGQTPQKAR